MFQGIVKAFRAVDAFLTVCENYTEQRIWNGKFIYDLKFLTATKNLELQEVSEKKTKALKASSSYITFIAFLKKIQAFLLRHPLLSDPLILITENLRFCSKYFAHYLIIIISGLASSYLLLMTFRFAPGTFVGLSLPLLYINHLFLSCFFIFIANKEKGAPLSLGGIFSSLKQSLAANTFIFLLQNSLLIISGVFVLSVSYLMNMFFSTPDAAWHMSFFYLLPVVAVCLVLGVLLYFAEIILAFCYPFILHEKKTAHHALQQSIHAFHTNPRYSLYFYLLLGVVSAIFLVNITTRTYEGGFIVAALFISHAFLFLGFIVRRNYFEKEQVLEHEVFSENSFQFTKLALIIGVFSYFSAGALFVRLQPEVLNYLEELRPTLAESYQYATYTNKTAGFRINYPQSWTLYEWSEQSASMVTNATGTTLGSVKVNVDVRTLEDSEFEAFYLANPGLINYDTETGNAETKILNTTINKLNAVKYIALNNDTGKLEFQTHYLIKNGDVVYDIALLTYKKELEEAYMEIYELMVKSFTIPSQE